MALDEPQGDPALNSQIYSDLGPSLADSSIGALPTDDPWSWVPSTWRDNADAGDDQIRRGLAGQHLAPAAVDPGATPDAPAAEVAPPAPPVTDPTPLPADVAQHTAGPTVAPPAPPPVLPIGAAPIAPPPPMPASDVLASPALPPGAIAPPLLPDASAQVALPYGDGAPQGPDVPLALPPVVPPPALDRAAMNLTSGGLVGAGDQKAYPELVPPPPQTPEQQHFAQTMKDYEGRWGDIPDPVERDAAAKLIATRRPGDFLVYQAHLAEAKDTRAAADRLQIERENLDREKQIYADRQVADKATQAKSDQIIADRTKLAGTHVDPGRWMSSRSPIQKVAAVLAAVIGGLVQGRTGSAHNIGLEFIQKQIDQDIDAQKADIENQKGSLDTRQGAVAQEFARTGNLAQAAETIRQTTYQTAINGLAAKQQDFAPGGTSFVRVGSAIAGLQSMQQASLETHLKEEHTQTLADIKEVREQALAKATITKSNAETAKLYSEINKAKEKDQVLTPAQVHAQFPDLPLAAIPPTPVTQKELGQHIETFNKSLETVDKTRANNPAELNRQLSVGEIVDNSGTPVRFRSEPVASKIADAKGAVDSGAHLIDKIVAARQRYGWSSDLIKSPEWRQMQADYGALVLQKKNTDQLGVLSESDMDLIGKSLGTTDPTEARDPIAGLNAARENMINNVNAQIRGQAVLPEGRTVQRWEPPAPPKPHEETKEEVAVKKLLAEDTMADRAAQLTPGLAERLPVFKEKRGQIDAMAADIRGPGPEAVAALQRDMQREPGDSLRIRAEKQLQAIADKRQAALGHLENVASNSLSPVVRTYASQALTNVIGSEIANAPEGP